MSKKNLTGKICQPLFLALAAFILLTTISYAQEPTPTPTPLEDDTPIKIDTLLLTIPFTVSDKTGRNIPSLKKEDFSVIQDGEKQNIEYFFNDEAPMNVAILLDTSVSTKPVLDNIQKAARDFLKVFRPEDRGIVVTFDSRTTFLTDLTSDRKKLTKAIDQTRIAEGAGSDMHDAVIKVLKNHFDTFKGRKAIIVLTDGMVTGREYTTQQILNTLQQSDTLFYPIIFKSRFYNDERMENTKRNRPLPIELLEFLAEESSGRFYAKDASNLKEAFQHIAEELKKQYLIGFYPQTNSQGKAVGHLRVAVNQPGFSVQTKKRNF